MAKHPVFSDRNPFHERNVRTFLSKLSSYNFQTGKNDGHKNDDGCVTWTAVCYTHRGKKLPYMWMRLPDGSRKQIYARHFAWSLHNGKPVPPGIDIRNVCGDELCVEYGPGHNEMKVHGKELEKIVKIYRQDGAIVHRAVNRPKGPNLGKDRDKMTEEEVLAEMLAEKK